MDAIKQKITIAIDAMGGDFGPVVTISACMKIAQDYPNLHFLFFGDKSEINKHLKNNPLSYEIIHTDLKINSDDKPSSALRKSEGTSMRMAIEAVKENKAHAVVSAGNTGALMALAKMVLKPMEGIHRPAIASVFPTRAAPTIMLDLGANVLVSAENLYEFAIMGAAFARSFLGKGTPRLGLLNVGSESIKGPDHVRDADELIKSSTLNIEYAGFVEGNDITTGDIDVIICDGYAGNIALKTAEGIGKFSQDVFKDAFKSNPLSILGAAFAYFGLKRVKEKIDPRLYNGGVFLGLNGICIKSHGGADILAFSSALKMAIKMSENQYIETLKHDLGASLPKK